MFAARVLSAPLVVSVGTESAAMPRAPAVTVLPPACVMVPVGADKATPPDPAFTLSFSARLPPVDVSTIVPGPADAVTAAPIVSVPEDCSVSVPGPVVVTVPVVVSAPVLFTVTVPLPAWLRPVTVSVAAVLVSAMLPLVELVAL